MRSEFKTVKGRKAQANRKAYQKRKVAKVPDKVKAYVKQALDREIQDKQDVSAILTTAGGSTTGFVRGYGINSASVNYGITTQSIIPQVTQGLDEDKRVGNYVRPKSLVVNYTLNAMPVDAGVDVPLNKNPTPFYCAVIFYSRKDSLTNNTNNTLKDFGSVNFPFETINDFLLPFNKELYNIHSFKKYKMAPAQEIGVFGTTQTIDLLNSVNGYVPMVMKSQTLKLPAKLNFDDATSQPTNARIYCAIGVFNIDNSVPDRATTIRVKCEMNSVLTYQNA